VAKKLRPINRKEKGGGEKIETRARRGGVKNDTLGGKSLKKGEIGLLAKNGTRTNSIDSTRGKMSEKLVGKKTRGVTRGTDTTRENGIGSSGNHQEKKAEDGPLVVNAETETEEWNDG